MKYICIFKDPGGGVQAFDFDSENERTALRGLLDRCVSEVNVTDGAIIDELVVWPMWLIREDMTRERIYRVGGRARVEEKGDAVVTETELRRMQTEDRDDG